MCDSEMDGNIKLAALMMRAGEWYWWYTGGLLRTPKVLMPGLGRSNDDEKVGEELSNRLVIRPDEDGPAAET